MNKHIKLIKKCIHPTTLETGKKIRFAYIDS